MPKRKAVSAEAGCDSDRPPEESPAEHATRGDAPPSPLCFDTPASLFQSLIQPCGSEEFFREHWEKRPLHLRRSDAAAGRYYGSLFRLSDLRGLCGRGLRYARDLNVCRCIGGRKKVLNGAGRVSYAALSRDLARKKATIQLHQPQRFKDELWRIQEKLECFFGSLVGSNVYITPEKSQGLPPHYDDVEVFILQLEGEKHWRLYRPTVPLATEYSLEPESRIGNPTHDILLKAGDLLYLPRGTIHQADTPEGVEHSTHLTLSTYQHMSYGDLLQDAVPSLLWDACRRDQALREGMPRGLLLASSMSVASSRLSALLRGLADDVEAGRLEPRSVVMGRDFVASRLPPYPLGGYGDHGDHLAPAGKVPALEDNVCLRFRDHILITMEPNQEKTDEATELVVFVLHSLKNQREGHMMGLESSEQDATSQGLRFPPSHLQALRQLQVEEKVSVKLLDLPSDEAKRNLALALWSESLLQVC